jgi:hypothetical protein
MFHNKMSTVFRLESAISKQNSKPALSNDAHCHMLLALPICRTEGPIQIELSHETGKVYNIITLTST